MRFSVIVPVYNSEKYLGECIDSLLNQTFTDFEVLLIDDGSTDSSLKKCQDYALTDSRIKVWHQENLGVSSARNKGLDEARGELILFVDCDDTVHERLLELGDKVFRDSNSDVCVYELTSNKNELEASDKTDLLLSEEEIDNLQIAIFNHDRQLDSIKSVKAPSPAKIYLRSIIEENKIRFDESLNNGEDGIFNLYYFLHVDKASYLKCKLYYYRLHGESITHKQNENTSNDFRELHKAYLKYLTINEAERFNKYLPERDIMSVSFCCMLDFCHEDNKLDYSKRKKLFLNEIEFYSSEIKKASLKPFGLKKKIVLFCIKQKWFFAVNCLCKLQAKL